MIRCPECERLTALYTEWVEQNADLLKEYHAALFARDLDNVNRIAEALPALEQFRKKAQEIMDEHRATHEEPERTTAG